MHLVERLHIMCPTRVGTRRNSLIFSNSILSPGEEYFGRFGPELLKTHASSAETCSRQLRWITAPIILSIPLSHLGAMLGNLDVVGRRRLDLQPIWLRMDVAPRSMCQPHSDLRVLRVGTLRSIWTFFRRLRLLLSCLKHYLGIQLRTQKQQQLQTHSPRSNKDRGWIN